MFAVKGWSVDTKALKTQQAVQPTAKKSDDGTGAASTTGGAGYNKKRKRGGRERRPREVTGSNVGELWATTIEGKKAPKKPRTDKKNQTDHGGEDKDDKTVVAADAAVPSDKLEADGQAQQENKEKSTAASDSKKAKNKKRQKQRDEKEKEAADKAVANTPAAPPSLPVNVKLTPMQAAMRQKLISARFRHLNETLYTAPSATSLALFADNPEMFDDYHSGFRQQVTTWPENPVDNFIRTIRDRAKVKLYNQNKAFRDVKRGKAPKVEEKEAEEEEESTATKTAATPLPRTHGTCTIADLGCGDARLAATFHEDGSGSRYNLKINSYDLQSPCKFVTLADIANLPCADGSHDVAIFCLALMGTNWIDFVEEAYRILHWKGELWVSEIKSRFGRVGGEKAKRVVEHSVGNRRKAAAKAKAADATRAKLTAEEEEAALREHVDEVVMKNEETDVSGFVDVLRRRGFVLKDENSVDLSNKMFVRMEFIKAAAPTVGKNVQKEGEERKGDDGTWKPKYKKFVEDEAKQVSVEDETKVLKPCLYKIR
jgi:ribosomal RNA-processing protein 8